MIDSVIDAVPGNFVRVDHTMQHMMVCLCDLSADDMVSHLAGVPISHCAEHKAAKLESMLKLGLAIGFKHVDEQGDFHCISLEDARARC